MSAINCLGRMVLGVGAVLLALLSVGLPGCAWNAPQPTPPYAGKLVVSEPAAGQEVPYDLSGIGQIQLEFEHAEYEFGRVGSALAMRGGQGQLLMFTGYFDRAATDYADFITLTGELVAGADWVGPWAADPSPVRQSAGDE